MPLLTENKENVGLTFFIAQSIIRRRQRAFRRHGFHRSVDRGFGHFRCGGGFRHRRRFTLFLLGRDKNGSSRNRNSRRRCRGFRRSILGSIPAMIETKKKREERRLTEHSSLEHWLRAVQERSFLSGGRQSSGILSPCRVWCFPRTSSIDLTNPVDERLQCSTSLLVSHFNVRNGDGHVLIRSNGEFRLIGFEDRSRFEVI